MKTWFCGIILFCFLAFAANAQTNADAAVAAALRNNPLIRAATLETEAKKYAEKNALRLPNPEVNAESPTGEFYAIGILQSFEFPTVYNRQKKVAQAETALAQVGQRVSENDLRFAVRSLYLETQATEFLARQWVQRDSLYQVINGTAQRQFTAGEIDLLQKTLVENELGKIHQERLSAEQLLNALRQQLSTLTGIGQVGALTPLSLDSIPPSFVQNVTGNPNLAFAQQSAQLANQQLELSKTQGLPNFSAGYLNQGVRGTPLDYRFRVTVGIPLWVGQYRAGRQSAASQAQAAQSRAAGELQTLNLELFRAQADWTTGLNQVRYYEREALPRGRTIIATATRMREAGQVDYLNFLRTLDEAFTIQREYVAQLQNANLSRIKLLYLAGQ
ncbi:MAG: TolC family protein [Haliscomenobacter sp.]|uniref:Outer membrane efflux protein n=1 Tax=Haliscomenobacter hydrossis (strain ATCC 27775 / DSM 1100 / LMG 10767 / O) TaxID=760192 RepID=F4L7T1_HALH1|nr:MULTISPECIES: TolC family protein [Haliscomenobacter]AEE54439.1 outer membrane efflux protein [Haliscomenobacter hydrossis DSM 1100]MBK9488830.1 TolC family protein [Haliscomenobacter sp.]